MHAEKVSEIIAHFIGLFETQIEDLRLRQSFAEGKMVQAEPSKDAEQPEAKDNFKSDLAETDYDPSVKYAAQNYDYQYMRVNLEDDFQSARARGPGDHDPVEIPVIVRHPEVIEHNTPALREEMQTETGPGSVAAHVTQANVVRDDDVLDMTDSQHHLARDVSNVYDWLGDASAKAYDLAPFASVQRTESAVELTKIADDIHGFAKTVEQQGPTTIQGADGSHYTVLAADQLDGSYVNGVLVADVPHINDFLPDRGLASQTVDSDGVQAPSRMEGSSGNSLDIATGANVVVNVVDAIDASIMAPVMAVMGNYHSIDAIAQVYIYSDRDQVVGPDAPLTGCAQATPGAQTIGMNIAILGHTQFQPTTTTDHSDDRAGDGSPVFPSFWRVSVVDGDVSFVHWTEQYNFLSDNDTMRVTTNGIDTTVLTGGNATVDLASYLGLGQQYDLMIVGGHAYDINSITQISVLYDNDTVSLAGGGAGSNVQTSGNLLWNLASIQNVGMPDRFASMPDYINETIKNIQDRNSDIPHGLANDPNFAGQAGLSVLYIKGNFFDVNVIKQVNVVGDSDVVNKVANDVLANNQNATVTIDTGSNAVVNIATITDYDSFGHTTYVAGNVYSDAVLIQGGLVDHDQTDASQQGHPLANEVIAFLDDHNPQDTHDGSIDLGHDMSWHNGAVGDVMQTVVS